MFDAVKDKAVLLMEFDQHLLEKEKEDKDSPSSKKPTQMPAVQMLAKNTDAIPVSSYARKRRLQRLITCYDSLPKLYNSFEHIDNSYTRIWMPCLIGIDISAMNSTICKSSCMQTTIIPSWLNSYEQVIMYHWKRYVPEFGDLYAHNIDSMYMCNPLGIQDLRRKGPSTRNGVYSRTNGRQQKSSDAYYWTTWWRAESKSCYLLSFDTQAHWFII